MLRSVIKLLQKNNDVAFAQHQLRRSFVRSPTEITEYARYAYEGKLNEQSNNVSCRGCDTDNANVRLLQQHALSAIRDFEKVDELAHEAGFTLQEDFEMPANNRLLVWHKSS